MRLAVLPQGILERIAFLFGVVPRPLPLAFWGMGVSRTLIVATRLGVFETLAVGDCTAAEVAARTDSHPEGMETLLNALNGFGFVRHRNGKYRNSREARRWLLPGAKHPLGDIMLFFDYLWDSVGSIEEGIRTGVPEEFHRADRPAEFWEVYARSFSLFARLVAREIVRRVRLPRTPARLLDVGGLHGLYAAAFARRYPGLEAEVIDLPAAVGPGQRIVAETGLSDRITFRAGDLHELEWGGGFDVVLLFNVLHNMSPEQAAATITRARGCLQEGGSLVILDSAHRTRRGDHSTVNGFNELFFFVINGTRPWPEEVLSGWMRDAGFSGIRRRRLLTMPAGVLITGTV